MDTSLLISIFLGFVFTFYALLVQSQPQNNPAEPRPPPKSFILPPRTPSPSSPSPPPPSPSSPSPFVPPPPKQPLSRRYPLRAPPPAPSHMSPPPRPPPSPRKSNGKASGGAGNAYRGGRRQHPPPPPRKLHNHKMNAGKKIGLLFVGVAVILQIGVVGFLVFKRRQLLKIKDRYETCY